MTPTTKRFIQMDKHNRSVSSLLTKLLMPILTLGALTSTASAQPTYPMICRAGGEMTMRIGTRPDLNLNRPYSVVRLKFSRSRGAYNRSTLRPGQCAWRDRAVSSREPSEILFYPSVRLFFEFPTYGVGHVVATVASNTGSRATVQAQNFLNLVGGNGFYTLSARNFGGHYFEIEDIRSGD